MYNHKEIEKKWQAYWEENKTFKIENDFSKPKYYTLDMFPFPSGAGLHVGHPEGMTANDIIARYKNAKGFNVLHPIGWDAFWLPAENYAIKTWTHPKITTQENINNFRKQIKSLGFSYDWDREVNTTDPDYYKWTQWIFLKLYEKGLAYEQDLPINYCPSCKTGLANEEVLNDFSCERCGEKVEKKKIRQWVLAITKYADRLLTDIDKLDWPEGLKEMQRNWIGKSEGCEFSLKKVWDESKTISVYTTRIDTVFGMTYAVLAPDHKDVYNFITPEQKEICEKYILDSSKKSDQDRTQDDKEKTWVFTGSYVINPFNGKEVPLWIWDYVLWNYWTWAVMAVPAHDERDFEFAKKYNLEIIQSVAQEYNWTWAEKYKEWLEFIKRKTIDVIIENDKWEFLLQTETAWWAKLTHFVWGWIEEWETELEAVKKEIIEETGYTDFEIVWPINNSFSWWKFFRLTKQKNVDVLGRCFYVKLKSDNQIKSEVDEWKHTIQWVKKEEVEKNISWSSHKYFWDLFVNWEKVFTDLWILVNSWEFDRLDSKTAQTKLIEFAEKNWFGEKKINYKLRDWLFSRQRYWGEPIPLIHLEIPNVKKLPHISEEEFDSLLNKIEKYLKQKMRGIPSEKQKLVEPLVNTTQLSSIIEFIQKLKKVKKKRTHNFKLKKVFTEVQINQKYNIRISWQYILEHFKNKSFKEKLLRLKNSETIINSLDNASFINNYAFLNIKWSIWVIILDKIEKNLYNLTTFYKLEKLNKKLNKAYILKRAPKAGEDDLNGTICPGSGMVRELVIWWKVFSKIRDWIYGKIVCDYNLPLELPEVEKFEPAGDGQSPLATVKSFVNVKLADNLVWKRETNTMPQWGWSCWYYLRYMNPYNKDMLVDREVEKYWGQVDSYVGGAEHAVLHLLYARFWHKFLFDIGVVSNDEPFYRLRNQGLITAYSFQNEKGKLIANDLVEEKNWKYFDTETWDELKQVIAKMSKSLKNVVNPDEIVEEYGADTLRLYEMYMADFKDSAPWDTKNIIWVRRFLDKVERAFNESDVKKAENDNEAMKLLNKTIKKVAEDIENYKFNTAIAAMMILVNYGRPTDKELFEEWKYDFIKILSPFAPHLAEELFANHSKYWNKWKKWFSVFHLDWPEVDETLLIENTITIAVQVLWKVRWTIEINKNEDKDSILEKAKNNPDITKWLEGKNLVKEIYVPGKIVNLVVK